MADPATDGSDPTVPYEQRDDPFPDAEPGDFGPDAERYCGNEPHHDPNPPEAGPPDGHWWNLGRGSYWGDARDNEYWCPRERWKKIVPEVTPVVVASRTVAETFRRTVLKIRARDYIWISPNSSGQDVKLRGRTRGSLAVYRPFGETADEVTENLLRTLAATEVPT